MTQNDTIRVTWDRVKTSYGLLVDHGSMVDIVSAAAFSSVATEDPWVGLVRKRQCRSTIAVSSDGSPVACVLLFDGDVAVALAAASYVDDDRPLFLGGDEISVVWGAANCQRLLPEVNWNDVFRTLSLE